MAANLKKGTEHIRKLLADTVHHQPYFSLNPFRQFKDAPISLAFLVGSGLPVGLHYYTKWSPSHSQAVGEGDKTALKVQEVSKIWDDTFGFHAGVPLMAWLYTPIFERWATRTPFLYTMGAAVALSVIVENSVGLSYHAFDPQDLQRPGLFVLSMLFPTMKVLGVPIWWQAGALGGVYLTSFLFAKSGFALTGNGMERNMMVAHSLRPFCDLAVAVGFVMAYRLNPAPLLNKIREVVIRRKAGKITPAAPKTPPKSD